MIQHPWRLARQCATLVVAALLVFATALPASAACCTPRSASMAAMHAAMPCCAQCRISNESSQTRDLDGISAPAPAVPLAAAAAIITILPHASAHTTAVSQPQQAFSPPSPFLLNEQFRI